MTIQRTLGTVRTLPAPSPGQFGPNHTAIEVIRPHDWGHADPFILLMDDRTHGKIKLAPHPHAGFETVTFIVDGNLPAEHRDGGMLAAGDVEWTTAGSGIVHGPDKPLDGHMRVLQLWLTLPRADRWTAPDHQHIRRGDALVRTEPGARIRLYSGRTGTLVSPTRNRVPTILTDNELEPGAAITQTLPASFTGFLYVLDGEARIGPDAQPLEVSELGWLDQPISRGATELRIANAGAKPLRVLLYAAERQNVSITWYGPFIGDTDADIARSIDRYRAGTFVRV